MLESILATGLTIETFFACTFTSLILGVGIAMLCLFRSNHSQSFAITLAMLPAVVQLVIMLVNGNIGVGVAVAGTFSLVRFRSLPGTAKEIGMLFLAMAIGLATGMGHLIIAGIFFAIMVGFTLVLQVGKFGTGHDEERMLKITIPEHLDYDHLFDDLFKEYTKAAKLVRVRSSNLGTMYVLDFLVELKGGEVPKAFLDALRVRNGNLEISCGRVETKEAL